MDVPVTRNITYENARKRSCVNGFLLWLHKLRGAFFVSMQGYLFLGHLFSAYCLSFSLSLTFESPFILLERMITGQSARHKKTDPDNKCKMPSEPSNGLSTL
ncbi:unnamed protein product, partial [Ixodes pacificus]